MPDTFDITFELGYSGEFVIEDVNINELDNFLLHYFAKAKFYSGDNVKKLCKVVVTRHKEVADGNG